MAQAEVIETSEGWIEVTCPLCGYMLESGICEHDAAEQLDFHVEDEHRDWQRVGYLHYERVSRSG